MSVALFDIDGTLLPAPSMELRFWWHLLRLGHQGGGQLGAWLRQAWRQRGPTLSSSLERSFERNKAYLRGLDPERLEGLARDWVPARIVPALFAPCASRLRWHRARGDEVVLLSGTLDFLARPLGDALGASRVVATRCAVAEGRFSDEPAVEHPVGERKRTLAAALCTALGGRLDEAYAYANSRRDLPLLAAVGTAVAVRPDLPLARAARERGWEILTARSESRSRPATVGD